jgi:hypothetical protein
MMPDDPGASALTKKHQNYASSSTICRRGFQGCGLDLQDLPLLVARRSPDGSPTNEHDDPQTGEGSTVRSA